MLYVIDKATSRIVYVVPEDGKYIVDKYSYLVESEPFTIDKPINQYKWKKDLSKFEWEAPKNNIAVQEVKPTPAPPPAHVNKLVVIAGILDMKSFDRDIHNKT